MTNQSLIKKQILTLLKLKIDYQVRNLTFLFIRLLLPIILAIIIVFLPKIQFSHQKYSIIQTNIDQLKIPQCYIIDSEDGPYGYGAIHIENTKLCKTFAVIPQNEFTIQFAQYLVAMNNLTLDDVQFFETYNEYLMYVDNHSQFIDFSIEITSNNSFTISYNHSKIEPDMYKLYGKDPFASQFSGQFSSLLLTLQLQCQNSIRQANGQQQISFDIGQIPSALDSNDPRIPSEFISMLSIILISIFQLILVIYDIVLEKQQNYLSQLRLLGLIDSIYIIVNFSWQLMLYLIQSMLFVLMTSVINNSSYFYFINPLLLFTLFMVAGLSITSFAFFIASFSKTIKTAIFISVGYSSIQICCFIIFVIMNSSHLFDSTFIHKWIAYTLIYLFPMFSLNIIFQQSFKLVNPLIDLDQLQMKQIIKGTKIGFEQAFKQKLTYSCLVSTGSSCTFTQPSILFVLFIQIIQSTGYIFAAWLVFEYIEDNYSLMRNLKQIIQQRKQLRFASNASSNVSNASSRLKCSLNELQQVIEDNEQADDLAIQLITQSLIGKNDSQIVLQTHALKKTFETFQAVKSVSLSLERGQLLGLLGQNGSGKTTTINMLIGALQPDKSQTALNQGYINGLNIRNQTQLIRQQIGVCPQFSILFSYLTPLQHLLLAQNLRNVDSKIILKRSEDMLRAVKLYDRRNDSINQLSGGMKRRVSIAMALVNDNSLIILDEPTGSLDPQCKRVIWDAIKCVQNGRNIYDGQNYIPGIKPGILLTSHDMVETEYLADQVIIMEDGRIKAFGDPLQLKNNYNNGNYITMQLFDKDQFQIRFSQFIQKLENSHEKIQLSELLDHQATIEIKYNGEYILGDLINLLDQMVEDKILINFNIFEGSLEQVFLNLTSQNKKQQSNINPYLKGKASRKQIQTIFYKLFQSDKSSINTLLGYIILPFVLMIICLVVAELFIPWLIGMVNITLDDVKNKVQPACTLCKLFYKKDQCQGYDLQGNMRLCEIIEKVNGRPLILPEKVLGGYQTTNIAQSMYNASYSLFITGTGSIPVYDQLLEFDEPVIDDGTITAKYINYLNNIYQVQDNKLPFSFIQQQVGNKYKVFSDVKLKYFQNKTFMDIVDQVKLIQLQGGLKGNLSRQEIFDEIPLAIINLNNSVPNKIFTYFPFNYPTSNYKYLGLITENSTTSLPPQQLITNMSEIFPNTLVVSPFSDVLARLFGQQVKIKSLPFMFTILISQAQERAKVLISLFFLLLACAAISPILAFNPVLDKEKNIQTLFNQLKLNPIYYWLANLIYQLVVTIIVHIFIYLLANIFQLSILTRMELKITVVLFSTSVICQIASAALLTVFRNSSIAILFGYLVILIQALASLTFGHFEQYKIRWWYFLTPQLALNSLFLMAGSSGKLGSEEIKLIYGCCFESIIIILIIVLVNLLVYLDYTRKKPLMYQNEGLLKPYTSVTSILDVPDKILEGLTNSSHDRAVINDEIDLDVELERQKVDNGSKTNQLVAINIQKQYRKQLAVRDITLQVDNEIFGLLGSSGAGKTTLVNIMASTERQSHGTVTIGLQNVRQVKQNIGICLQDDVFLPSLTVIQHLKMFAMLKGVDLSQVDKIAESVGLEDKLNSKVGQLSGGMRRRMNLAIGMM